MVVVVVRQQYLQHFNRPSFPPFQRLDIVPIVCNVEQVRILRGLGAIQPGVNRCKLLSTHDFDVLYKDCTTAR